MAPWDSGSRLPIDTDEEEAQEDGAEGVGKGGSAAVRGAAGVGVWPLPAAVLWLRGVYSAFFFKCQVAKLMWNIFFLLLAFILLLVWLTCLVLGGVAGLFASVKMM